MDAERYVLNDYSAGNYPGNLIFLPSPCLSTAWCSFFVQACCMSPLVSGDTILLITFNATCDLTNAHVGACDCRCYYSPLRYHLTGSEHSMHIGFDTCPHSSHSQSSLSRFPITIKSSTCFEHLLHATDNRSSQRLSHTHSSGKPHSRSR